MEGVFRLISRFLFFFIPLLLGITLFEYAMYRSGDSWPTALVVQKQKEISGILYGRKNFSHNFFHYKKRILENNQADIVVLGSSRVMQIRDFMFSPMDDSFYNFGGMVRNVFELKTYCDLVIRGEVHKPKVFIVGIDPWWFNKDKTTKNRYEEWRGFDWFPNLSDHLAIGLDFLRGTKKVPFDAIINGVGSKSPYYGYYAIGVAAIQDGSGFRSDGSRQYSPEIIIDFLKNPIYTDREVPPIIDRVKKNDFITIPQLEYISVLVDALGRIHNSGVEVYAVLPPFSSEVLEEIEQSSKKGWKMYTTELPDMLKGYGIQVISSLSPNTYGLDDTYMFDGMHPSEVFMGYSVYDLLTNIEETSFLQQIDSRVLANLLETVGVISLSLQHNAFPENNIIQESF